jgi:hypothetical protein
MEKTKNKIHIDSTFKFEVNKNKRKFLIYLILLFLA